MNDAIPMEALDSHCEESMALIDNMEQLERSIRDDILTKSMKEGILRDIVAWRDTENRDGCVGKQYGKFVCADNLKIGVHLSLPVEYQNVLFDDDEGPPSLIWYSEPYEIKEWLKSHKTIGCLFAWDKKKKFFGASAFACCTSHSTLFVYKNTRLQVYLKKPLGR